MKEYGIKKLAMLNFNTGYNCIKGVINMQSLTFDELVKAIPSLNNMQKEKLYITLKNVLGSSIVFNDNLLKELRETKFKEELVCPHCGCHHVVRYGKYNNHQRYKCKDCDKTFSDFTLTPMNKTLYT